MDEIVKAALKKWPNVPDCYGWLALDARGDWYMRDERTQAAGPFPQVKGSRILPVTERGKRSGMVGIAVKFQVGAAGEVPDMAAMRTENPEEIRRGILTKMQSHDADNHVTLRR